MLPDISFVQIQTASNCTADCLFCPWSESWHHDNPGKMDDRLFEKILGDLKPFEVGINAGKVCLYLMNEPLSDRDIFKKIRRVYEVFPRTEVEISTNATNLNERAIAQLLNVFVGRRHSIWVSHHGIDKESLEHIMAIPFERVQENLIRLMQASAGRLNIRVRGAGESRDGRFRYFSGSEWIEYMRSLIRDNEINPQGIDIDSFTFHDRAGQIHRSERNANQFNVGKVREIGAGHPFYCSRVDRWVHIGYDGTLYLCCHDYHRTEKLPSLKEISLIEYFESAAYQNLYAKVTGQTESSDEFICKKCISPGG